jgi:anti-sigma regulatory factor (Ser/Thr protein kinase)
MFELALHILDLVQNSVAAGASIVIITIKIDAGADLLTISIKDDGCGMDDALKRRVTSPFATTRTTRKVGLGIPMFKQCAEMCAGRFCLKSQAGEGTELTASFRASHMDLPPLGDIKGTMLALIAGNPETPEFVLRYAQDDQAFDFDTRPIREALGGAPLAGPEIFAWLDGYLTEGISRVEGGAPIDDL